MELLELVRRSNLATKPWNPDLCRGAVTLVAAIGCAGVYQAQTIERFAFTGKTVFPTGRWHDVLLTPRDLITHHSCLRQRSSPRRKRPAVPSSRKRGKKSRPRAGANSGSRKQRGPDAIMSPRVPLTRRDKLAGEWFAEARRAPGPTARRERLPVGSRTNPPISAQISDRGNLRSPRCNGILRTAQICLGTR